MNLKIKSDVIMIIFSAITAVVCKNPTWIVCALLWIDIAVIEYCNSKINDGKDEIIDMQEQFIDKLLNELDKRVKFVYLKNIKIPEYFTNPKQKKFQERVEYFCKNKKFKVPIVINENNELLDGYTSYLIAKNFDLEIVEVKEVFEKCI